MGWTGMTSSKRSSGEDTVEIDPTFAAAVSLESGTKLTINVQLNAPVAHTIHLEPLTASDWDLVELHASFLESRMINQVRAVSTVHPITVYPSPTAVATLKVVKIEPDPAGKSFSFARLSPESEVVIAPKLRKKKPSQQQANKKGSARSVASTSRRRQEPAGPCILLRGVALPHPAFPHTDSSPNSLLAYQVFINAEDLPYPLSVCQFVNISVVRPQSDAGGGSGGGSTAAGPRNNNDNGNGEINLSATNVIAKLVSCYGPPDHVGLSPALSISLDLVRTIGHIIKIEPAPSPLLNLPSAIILHPFSISTGRTTSSALRLLGNRQSDSDKAAAEEKKSSISLITEQLHTQGLLSGPITNNMKIPATKLLPYGAQIELKGAEGWVRAPGFKVPLELEAEVVRPESSVDTYSELDSLAISPVSSPIGVDNILDSVNSLIRSPSDSQGVIVYGSRGSGKTAILKELERSLEKDLIHPISVSCGPLSSDQPSALKETLRKSFVDAAWFSPSVIMFDDLDLLIPAELEHADSTKTRILAEYFQVISSSIFSQRSVFVIATAQSKESLHSHLISGHVFEELYHLKAPSKDIRKEILEQAILQLGMSLDPQFDLLECAASTEGYQPGDLKMLAERINHESIVRSAQDGLTIGGPTIQQDFNNAIDNFVPSSLRGVKLQKSGASWTEIGGLKETKSILLETLEWPTKYAPIFANCPLRLRSGLLLYGFPGCGKTLLASAVAAQCGLNFISIKGPEILNKYIGASEQSVRDLFDRAQAAKPCILFFDEFDSIAPKRGHDSTGVTDRVVNQMLTQMDGAEGLDGVYVLAATSRPDLIDSALLRPGRLDKSLLCGMPSIEDRIDILNALQTKMTISKEVDINELAQKTEGFSGADLQALLYNAYLDAVHDIVDEDIDKQSNELSDSPEFEFFQVPLVSDQKETPAERMAVTKSLEVLMKPLEVLDNGTSNGGTVVDSDSKSLVEIRSRHLEKSINETQPSISRKERLKLEAIYHQFVSGRSGDMPDGIPSTDIGGRATLM